MGVCWAEPKTTKGSVWPEQRPRRRAKPNRSQRDKGSYRLEGPEELSKGAGSHPETLRAGTFSGPDRIALAAG